MRITNEYCFFWKNTCLGQWHPSIFVIDGITYKTAEQYMMAEKARLFNDKESEDLILSNDSPRECQKLGRLVKNFNLPVWNENARDIVYCGNEAKFTQNPEFLKTLMSFDDRKFVEASPYDDIWGIKIGEKDDRCLDPKLWEGTNWLGQVLTKLRDNLKNPTKVSSKLVW